MRARPGRDEAVRLPPLWLLFAMMFVGQFATNVYLPGLPYIARDLETSLSAAQTLVPTYLASFAVAQLVMGPLSDRFGAAAHHRLRAWPVHAGEHRVRLCADDPDVDRGADLPGGWRVRDDRGRTGDDPRHLGRDRRRAGHGLSRHRHGSRSRAPRRSSAGFSSHGLAGRRLSS